MVEDHSGSVCIDCTASDVTSAGVCGLCLADHGELHSSEPLRPALAPTLGPLRFADILVELQALVELADTVEGTPSVSDAARRLERVLERLRAQFLRDLGVPVTGSAGELAG